MTTMTDRTVRITASIATAGALQAEFGRTLYLVNDGSTPTTALTIAQQRSSRGATVYANATAVNADFPAGSSAREGAAIYFQQNPFPRNLVIGSQISAAQNGYVFGADLPAASVIAALGSVALVLGGTSVTVDFTGVATVAAAATLIQTALRAARFGATTTVTVVSNTLVVQVPQAQSIATGFDDSTQSRTLGLFGSDTQVFDGLAAETAIQALDRIQAEDDSWYYLALDPLIYDSAAVIDIANWVSSRTKMLALDSTQGTALTANETTSTLAQVFALGQSRVFGFWSSVADHKALSLAARLSSVDFSRPASVITAKFRQLPGTTPDVLATGQLDELTRKRVNFYTRQHGTAIVAEGTSFNGWIDERVWLDWFVDAMRRAIFAELTAARRVPQTDEGMAALLDVVIGVCEQGVRNGGIAPGQVSSTLTREIQMATGNSDFDGVLSNGYLVYAPPIAEQSLSDRQSRVAPPISVWVKGSGAIQRVDIAILFEG